MYDGLTVHRELILRSESTFGRCFLEFMMLQALTKKDDNNLLKKYVPITV
jgi:hypothetical protein